MRPCRCASEHELDEVVSNLMNDPIRRARLGAAARALVAGPPRRQGQDTRRHQRAAATAGSPCRGAAVPCGPLNPLGAVYGRVADLRRQWYARHPERRRTLGVPVISVGNLVVGGSGKTPVTAALAQLLLKSGERPAILSRGYRRRTRPDDVVVVSDGASVLASVRESGDEPQMLARSLHGVPVVVCARRYRAGELAVSRFGSTVLVLDDGFQHLELARDVDLLIVSPDDLHEQVLPAGSLREPLDAGRMADAVLVPAAADEAQRVAKAHRRVARIRGGGAITTPLACCRSRRSSADAGSRIPESRVPGPASLPWPASRVRNGSSTRCARSDGSWRTRSCFPIITGSTTVTWLAWRRQRGPRGPRP